ncbi:MAG TPA: T9SS type A sorting domain-containing protein [Cyclobacteriaceae bacterium]|nr:T9SS type A sorting domain-containing protein [Cyclobacteriaceae bacterium]
MRKSSLIIFIVCLLAHTVFAQFTVVPIPKTPGKKQSRMQARQQLAPMRLPFWDDFSFSNSPYYPHDTLWQSGSSVSLNFGTGINPPSLGVVTFDGLDSLGKPYNVSDALAKGFADSLISRPLSLDLVPAALRPTVYLSFYYQFMGNGEAPDPGDNLTVDFKNDQGKWENAKTIGIDASLKADSFNTMVIPVADDRFFHPAFQFRFRSFGRLSGPYDTWNVDYVYLNSGRDSSDTSFPDRAIATPLTSLFNEYWSIPKKHFMTDVAANLTKPSLSIYNLRVGNIQPLSYSYHAEVVTYHPGPSRDSVIVVLQDSTSVGNGLAGRERRTFTVGSIPDRGLFDVSADSFKIKLRLSLATKDNVLPANNGDYDSAKYKPIDFRVNDTTRAEFALSDYYAYDDGTAEYGIGLNQPGAQVAYLFEMKTAEPDTIVAIDFYFPRFGDESSQIILLRILSDLTDTQQSVLYEENMAVDRSEQNKFKRHILTPNAVGVQGSFYIGWKQSSAGTIPIGWDKNTDSGDKIYSNTNGLWDLNLIEKGSMMVHPVFGKGGVVTGISDDVLPPDAFPNPSSGIFYLPEEMEYVQLFDLAGKPVGFSREVQDHQTKITMTQAYPGLYVLKTLSNKKYTTQKIMVRP